MSVILAIAAIVAGGGPLAFAQGLSKPLGAIYDSTKYAGWGASVASGNSATGSQTITVCPAFQTLPDGRLFNPWSTAMSFTIDPAGGSSETLTPSAVSQVTAPVGYSNQQNACENVTATFSNTHGASLNPLQIISGDQGIQEAISDAQNSGGGDVFFLIDSGTLTLSTSGANTTFGANIPTRSVISGASLRVLTTIGTCAGGWSLGWSTGTEITAANTTLTAGTTSDSSTHSEPVAFNAAATQPLVHCTTSNASAGVVHAKVWGFKHAAPAN
jgi:hypothetical protein